MQICSQRHSGCYWRGLRVGSGRGFARRKFGAHPALQMTREMSISVTKDKKYQKSHSQNLVEFDKISSIQFPLLKGRGVLLSLNILQPSAEN